ncbi:MAG: hypothetical protein RR054_04395 [Clostridia bacterium]
MKTKKVRINWTKMHTHGYGGNCIYCGGNCTDTDSIKNWQLASNAYNIALQNNDIKYANYLRKKLQDKQNFVKGY